MAAREWLRSASLQRARCSERRGVEAQKAHVQEVIASITKQGAESFLMSALDHLRTSVVKALSFLFSSGRSKLLRPSTPPRGFEERGIFLSHMR